VPRRQDVVVERVYRVRDLVDGVGVVGEGSLLDVERGGDEAEHSHVARAFSSTQSYTTSPLMSSRASGMDLARLQRLLCVGLLPDVDGPRPRGGRGGYRPRP
jgi:hypothetical protein